MWAEYKNSECVVFSSNLHDFSVCLKKCYDSISCAGRSTAVTIYCVAITENCEKHKNVCAACPIWANTIE